MGMPLSLLLLLEAEEVSVSLPSAGLSTLVDWEAFRVCLRVAGPGGGSI